MNYGYGRLLWIRRVLKHLWFQILFRTGATAWARWRLSEENGTIVLTLHRVLDDHSARLTNSPGGMIVRQQTFQRALDYLSKTIEVIPLQEGASFKPGLHLALTFDDGWIDNFESAVPELLQRAIPSCIFLCSDMVGKVHPFWPERANAIWKAAISNRSSLNQLKLLLRRFGHPYNFGSQEAFLEMLKGLDSPDRATALHALADHFSADESGIDSTMCWEHLRELHRKGVAFGSHTANHEILPGLSQKTRERELSDSKLEIYAQLGEPVRFFSYPNGNWDVDSRESVKTCGYCAAFTNEPGLWCKSTDPYVIPRTNISEGRLTGFTGSFSAATLHYFVFWLPYRVGLRKRQGKQSVYNHSRRSAWEIHTKKQEGPVSGTTLGESNLI